MARSLSDELRITRPCHEDESSMTPSPSGRGLYCHACASDVHVVAEMTRSEVAALVAGVPDGERLCLELMVRDVDGAIVVADGYVRSAHVSKGRALPLLAVAASMTMAACATSSGPRSGENVVLVPPPPSPGTGAPVAPALLAAPSTPSAPPRAAAPIDDPGPAADPDADPMPAANPPVPRASTRTSTGTPAHPARPPVRPNHTMTKGGRG